MWQAFSLKPHVTTGKSRSKAHELKQSLGVAEEKQIVKQIEDMDHRGDPMRIDRSINWLVRFWPTGKEKKL